MSRRTDHRIRRLTVEPTAGLGNRMRVVAAALDLASQLECPLRLVWTRTGALGCRFDDLFAPIDGVAVAEHAWTTSRLERRIGARLGFYHYLTQPEIERLRAADRLGELAQSLRPYLITFSRFLPARGHVRRLVPIPEIAKIVDDMSRTFTPHTVGVHIRRGENDPASATPPTAPLECFLAAMRDRVAAEPRTSFFLATDSRTEQAAIESAFGSRVMALTKPLDRWMRDAIRAALVDLLCLSRTSVILGSEGSSFSEIAAEIGETRLVVIRPTAAGV